MRAVYDDSFELTLFLQPVENELVWRAREMKCLLVDENDASREAISLSQLRFIVDTINKKLEGCHDDYFNKLATSLGEDHA